MDIRVAKTAGFCMGVRRAVEMVFDLNTRRNEGPLYTFGPLIHNAQVLDLLRQKGIRMMEQIPESGRGTVLLRAHGVPPRIAAQLKQAGFQVQDATCPRVVKIQQIIDHHTRKGAEAIIIGDPDHPEVVGLLGFAHGRGRVVDGLDALRTLPRFERAVVVAQSTQNMEAFREMREWVAAHHPDYTVFNTICDSTENRQAEIRRLAADVKAVVVVGGRTSGNTRRLADVARLSGKPVWQIETAADLSPQDRRQLAAAGTVGVSAGASTPNWVIKNVIQSMSEIPRQKTLGLGRLLNRLERLVLFTNLYVALAAGCLAYACAKLEGVSGHLPFFFLSFFYVLSMHTLNHLTGQRAERYNDPERFMFYRDHRRFLLALAIASALSGATVAAVIGPLALAAYTGMSLLGLSYHLKIVPERLSGGRARRVSDIPATKIFLVTFVWPILAVLVPPLTLGHDLGRLHLILFVWAGGLAFARTALKDILDMQGDRIIGRKTIALILGEQQLLRLLNGLLCGLILMLAVSAALHWITPVTLVITLLPVLYFLMLQGYRGPFTLPGVRLELLAESHFILVGLMAWPLRG